MKYAGFWVRLRAGIVDMLVLLPFVLVLMWLGFSFSRTALVITFLPMSFLYPFYNIYFHARWGQTVGKMATGIRVVKLSGDPISWREAFFRSSVDVGFGILTAISSMIALMNYPEAGFHDLSWSERMAVLENLEPTWTSWVNWAANIWIWSEVVVLLFNKKRRALHDFIAGTVVIHIHKEEVKGPPIEKTRTDSTLGDIMGDVPPI